MKVLDLFSGIGGFALATHWAGGETIAFAETAKYPSTVLKHRFPGVPNLGDVTKICRRTYDCIHSNEDDTAHCPRCNTDFGECDCIGTDQFTDTYGFPDVIVGGVPCQPASLVGKRRGSADVRWLWPDTIRIVGELQPRFVLLENPRAILTLEGGSAFRGILSSFADIGYDVQWHRLPASALGAGHRRERVWILASHTDCQRLERHPGNGPENSIPKTGGHPAPENLRQRKIDNPFWYRQSGVEPVCDGLPPGVARHQLTAIGNSVVPQVAYVFMKAIHTMLHP